MRRARYQMVLILAWLFGTFLAWPIAAQPPAGTEAGTAAVKNPVAATPESIAAGRATFQKNCRFCHGEDAKGNGPQAPKGSNPPDLTDNSWGHGDTDADILNVIQNGLGPDSVMKAYKGRVTVEETWNIINYLRSLEADRKVP